MSKPAPVAAQVAVWMWQLLHGGDYISARRLREKWGVGSGAVGRYIRLAKETWPLVAMRCGREIHWTLDEGAPTAGDHELAAALQFAAVALGDLEGTRHHACLVRAARAARHRLRDDVTQLEASSTSFCAVRPEASLNPDYAAHIEFLLDCVRDRRSVQFDYRKLDSERLSYKVDPWTVTFYRGRAALVGGKHDGKRWPKRRTFAVDRIRNLRRAKGPRFPAAERFDPTTFLEDSFGIYVYSDEDPEDVVLRVRGAAAVLLGDRKIHYTQKTTELGDGWLEVRLRVYLCPELHAWVLSLLPDVRVIEPSALAESVRAACLQHLSDGH